MRDYRAVLLPLLLRFVLARNDEGLVSLLSMLRQPGSSLFGGDFGGLTVFGCRDNDGKAGLLRDLSRIYLAASVLDTVTAGDRLAQLAWTKDSIHADLPLDAHQQLFALELDCPGTKEFVARANVERMFSQPYRWLLLQSAKEELNETLATLANADLLPDSELVIWNESSGELVSPYKTHALSERHKIERRGSWIASELKIEDSRPTSRRRRNLDGMQLKSCLVITDPDTINHLSDYQERHVDSITKCNYPWALHLVNMLNATVSFETAKTWGYQGANGSWGGMIGMLQRNEIDFGGTGTFLMRERIGVIQYISLSTPTGSRFIFRRPPLSSTANLFKLPFRPSVWMVICGLFLLLVGLLYPAMRFEWRQWRDRDRLLEPRLPNLSDDLLVVVGAVSQQGSWYEPRAVSTRIMILMALLAAVILYAAYTANIVALLTATTTSIRTLRELLDSPLQLAAHDNVFNRYYFGAFKDPVRRAIYEERIEPRGGKRDNWLEIEDGVERMRRGYFAFHVEPGCAYKIVQETYREDEKCGFHEIDFLNVFDPHFIVKRRSPYLELLRFGGLRLHESGMRTRDINRLYTKKPICSSASRFLSVGLTECRGAFEALFFGLLLGFAVFVLELLLDKARGSPRDLSGPLEEEMDDKIASASRTCCSSGSHAP